VISERIPARRAEVSSYNLSLITYHVLLSGRARSTKSPLSSRLLRCQREASADWRRQSLTDGILDAAVLCRYETAVRPEALRWKEWIEGQKRKIFGGLAVLEAETAAWGDEFAIGQVGAACVLGYLDFRFADWDWRGGHPQLKGWFERVSARPSVSATRPG